MTETSLRERKKVATRQALSRAAALLAVERGVEGVTIEAIADAAGVSPRTFHNYFPGKEEAIVAPLTDGAQAVIDALRARPAGEPIWEALREVVREALLPTDTRDETIALLRVVKQNPALVGKQLCGLGEMQRQIAEVVAARTGTDAGRDLYPHLLAGAAGVAMRTAVDLWVDGRTGAELPELIDSAFAQLRAGLPGP
ncbi:acyl-CoA-like ligand-binding transcription factor [Actinomadura opuntiae]|uniref:acyl-CoA-like ligand-binding transcription factor n=1 Tax=Actinomadura sp. OS1-43 TaxID=604315 RepID=UPI00255A99C0|nr:TetR family transcriptional regulator [Actinomadura sp. OS1-43]MDL4813007.1 TetR family transcriptional regulator [Actinomadura sp. OS1-43]